MGGGLGREVRMMVGPASTLGCVPLEESSAIVKCIVWFSTVSLPRAVWFTSQSLEGEMLMRPKAFAVSH